MKVFSEEKNTKTVFIIYLVFYSIFLVILSFFRDAVADETFFLRETMIISELLKKGIWFGDYGVGLHGFLFKIPVALVFIILGRPSVFTATLFTIFISVSSIWIFYNIVDKYFFKGDSCFWATVLFSASLYFIRTSVSFLRDIPAVFTVLLFLFLFLKNSNRWLIGLSLLLMLDAKEHVFFTVAPVYGLYILLEELRMVKEKGVGIAVANIITRSFAAFVFSLLYIILMFGTSIIPLNIFLSAILGFNDFGLDWITSQFSFEFGSANLLDEGGKEIFKLSDFIQVGYGTAGANTRLTDILISLIKVADVTLAYIGKILYPRTFSFISIPKIITLPAIVIAYKKFRLWWSEKDKGYLLPMILFFNVVIFILRASHGRYLLCVSSLFMLFFIMYIKEGFNDLEFSKNILLATTLFVLLGLAFETTFIMPKIILELSLLFLFWATWFLRYKKQNIFNKINSIFIIMLSGGMVLTSLAFSYSIGQISVYSKYGYNREVRLIAESFNPEDVIWINNFGSNELLNMYRKDMNNEPEWVWGLQNWVPKKHLLKVFPDFNTYTWNIIDMENLQSKIKYYDIDKIAIVISTLDKNYFHGGDYLFDIFAQDWLQFEKKVDLMNKGIYIFNIIDTGEVIL